MIVLCDVDGVLADFIGRVCVHVGAKPEDFKSFDLEPHLNDAQMQAVKDLCKQSGFARTLSTYPDAANVIRDMRRIGHQVIAVTAPWEASQTWCYDRKWWLAETVGITDVVFASSSTKRFVAGDVLIEDNADTLASWVKEGYGIGILVDRPWNRSAPVHSMITRVGSLREAYSYIANGLELVA